MDKHTITKENLATFDNRMPWLSGRHSGGGIADCKPVALERVGSTPAFRTIHWAGTPEGFCERKDSGADVSSKMHGKTTITNTALCYHYGNTTCEVCLNYIRGLPDD